MSRERTSEGEACLLHSLQLARQRELLALELRVGVSLARLWAGQAQGGKAIELLEPIFARFSEGFETRDLVAAATLLRQLRSRN
jgi:predicted ATPase